MQSFFTTILYQPLLNLLVWIYGVIPGQDIGLAIIILTILLKLLLNPLSKQSLRQQRALTQLQPKIEELKIKHKDNKEALAKEMMELYRQEKVNPLSSCLPLLIQLPFLIAVYHVFNTGLHSGSLDLLYSFVPNPGQLDPYTIGGLDLSKPNIVLALLAGAAQFWQARMMLHRRQPVSMPGAKDENMMAMMNKQMMYVMPAMTVFIGLSLPAGLALYWFVTTVMTGVQQLYLFKQPKPAKPAVIEGERTDA